VASNPDGLVGIKFGRLEVIGFSHKDHKSNSYFDCRCECGTVKTVAQNHLVSGKTKSCGCLKKNRKGLASELQTQVDDLRRHLDKGLKEIGSGAVYTILEVLEGYSSSNANVVNFQIIQVKR
jgi:hypothetical protein